MTALTEAEELAFRHLAMAERLTTCRGNMGDATFDQFVTDVLTLRDSAHGRYSKFPWAMPLTGPLCLEVLRRLS